MSTEARIALDAAVRLLKLRGYRPRDWQAASTVLRGHVVLALGRLTERARERVWQIHEEELTEAGLAAAKEISERGL